MWQLLFEECFELAVGLCGFGCTDHDGVSFGDGDGDALSERQEWLEVGSHAENLEIHAAQVFDLDGLLGFLGGLVDPLATLVEEESAFDVARTGVSRCAHDLLFLELRKCFGDIARAFARRFLHTTRGKACHGWCGWRCGARDRCG